MNRAAFAIAFTALSMSPLGVAAQPTQALALAPEPPTQLAQAETPSAVAAQTSGYVLGPNDEIAISVFGQPDLSTKTRIKPDGTIILAFLGPVIAQGKSTSTLSNEIAGLYSRGGYLTNPSVNVEVASFVSKTVTVLGNVGRAGNYPLDRPYTVASMIAQAGGVSQTGANVVLLTPGDGSPPKRISLLDLQADARRALQAGDTLVVPNAEMVYVYGQVNTPGAYPYQPELTYRQALARAGGPTLAGSTRKIDVRRAGKEIKGLLLDDLAKPEDVLIIREKLF
jgi:polysaccharide biosynthesis/export protein